MERRLREKIDYKRKQNNRNFDKRILIVCEGEKTEPNYFEAFKKNLKINSIDIQVKGMGKNTLSLVESAIEFQKNAKDDNYPYSEIWCVFDRDDFSEADFNNAIKKAKAKKFKVAYSNECFELWYILHFEYLEASSDRKSFEKKLTKHLGFKYQKNSKDMYEILLEKQDAAIRNAKKLLIHHKGKTPAKSNPSTTVHLLVAELNRVK